LRALPVDAAVTSPWWWPRRQPTASSYAPAPGS